MKTCTRCGETRPLAEFNFNRHTRDKRASWCKPCTKSQSMDAYRLKTYGLTPAAFNAMREAQGNRCAICTDPFTQTPRVDHCHATGAVRALTCGNCNTMLGMANDSPKRLRAAAAYIELHQTSHRRKTD